MRGHVCKIFKIAKVLGIGGAQGDVPHHDAIFASGSEFILSHVYASR